MPNLLHVDSSPLGEFSVSRRLTATFVNQWTSAHPDGVVIRRDLTQTPLDAIDAEWIDAARRSPELRTPGERDRLALSDDLIAELERADEWVFGVPMHNFTVPTVLRLWLDQVLRAGRTFSYAGGAPEGLLKNKKAHFFITSGGVYTPGSPAAGLDFVQPYLKMIFGFMGVTDTRFHTAGGVAAVTSGKMDRQIFLAPHLEAIRAEFQSL